MFRRFLLRPVICGQTLFWVTHRTLLRTFLNLVMFHPSESSSGKYFLSQTYLLSWHHKPCQDGQLIGWHPEIWSAKAIPCTYCPWTLTGLSRSKFKCVFPLGQISATFIHMCVCPCVHMYLILIFLNGIISKKRI